MRKCKVDLFAHTCIHATTYIYIRKLKLIIETKVFFSWCVFFKLFNILIKFYSSFCSPKQLVHE